MRIDRYVDEKMIKIDRKQINETKISKGTREIGMNKSEQNSSNIAEKYKLSSFLVYFYRV